MAVLFGRLSCQLVATYELLDDDSGLFSPYELSILLSNYNVDNL